LVKRIINNKKNRKKTDPAERFSMRGFHREMTGHGKTFSGKPGKITLFGSLRHRVHR
jgi:hypothetical protein